MKTRFALALVLAVASGAAFAAEEEPETDWHLLQWDDKEIDYADLATRAGDPGERSMWIAIAKKIPGGVSRDMVAYSFNCPKKTLAPIEHVVIGPDGKDVSDTEIAPVFVKPAKGSREAGWLAMGCSDEVGDSVHAYFDEDIYDWAAKAMADPKMLSEAVDAFRLRDMQGSGPMDDSMNAMDGNYAVEDWNVVDAAMNAADAEAAAAAAEAAEAAVNAM